MFVKYMASTNDEILIEMNSYMSKNKIKQDEGTSSTAQLKYFSDFIKNKNYKKYLEIGYHMGHSVNTILYSNSTINATTIDLFPHKYSDLCIEFTKTRFTDRVNFIKGSSFHILPTIKEKFDVIFIDGDHSYHGVKTDLSNCLNLCHEDTIIIMDDLVPFHSWGIDVCRVWNEFIDEQRIIPLDVIGEFGNGGTAKAYSSDNPLFALDSKNTIVYNNNNLLNYNGNISCRRWGILKKNFGNTNINDNLKIISDKFDKIPINTIPI